MIAMELSSLAELGPGRFRIQIGTGDPSLVKKLGKRIERPARSTEEFVRSLRDALAGNEMNVEYPGYAFRGFRVEVIDGIALVATSERLGETLERYAATGIDELAVSIFAAPEEQPAIVEQLALARPAKLATGRDQAPLSRSLSQRLKTSL